MFRPTFWINLAYIAFDEAFDLAYELAAKFEERFMGEYLGSTALPPESR